MVKTLRFQHKGTGSIPGRGNKIPHTPQLGKKEKKETDFEYSSVCSTVNPWCLSVSYVVVYIC